LISRGLGAEEEAAGRTRSQRAANARRELRDGGAKSRSGKKSGRAKRRARKQTSRRYLVAINLSWAVGGIRRKGGGEGREGLTKGGGSALRVITRRMGGEKRCSSRSGGPEENVRKDTGGLLREKSNLLHHWERASVDRVCRLSPRRGRIKGRPLRGKEEDNDYSLGACDFSLTPDGRQESEPPQGGAPKRVRERARSIFTLPKHHTDLGPETVSSVELYYFSWGGGGEEGLEEADGSWCGGERNGGNYVDAGEKNARRVARGGVPGMERWPVTKDDPRKVKKGTDWKAGSGRLPGLPALFS